MADDRTVVDKRTGAEIITDPKECHHGSLELFDESGFPRGVSPLKQEDMYTSDCKRWNNREIESSSSCQSLVITIQEKLGKLPELSQTKERCIYRVPKLLRQVKEKAYTPALVSIGPFHHKDERLLPMEALKLRHLKSFIETKSCRDLNPYIQIIKGKERRIRDCYAEDFPMSSDEFVQMILVDSIFIIELFRFKMLISNMPFINYEIMPFKNFEIMPFKNYEEVYNDLWLAENQLPFFILEDMYSAAFKPHESTSVASYLSFMDIACKVLKVDPITNEATGCFHLLDLQRTSYLQSHERTTTTTTKKPHRCIFQRKQKKKPHRGNLCPTAMSLREAGVKFRVSDKPCSLLDIHFDKKKGILTIPRLIVQDDTESIFRNMIAFEQCCCYPNQTTCIAEYHCFMDCLINTWEDVNLLVEAGIIENWLGSDKEVSCLINSLGAQVSSSHYYARLTEQLNNYCDKRWNRYRATLKHTYFKHPWAALSVIYAIILLLLTIAQLLTGILALPGVMK